MQYIPKIISPSNRTIINTKSNAQSTLTHANTYITKKSIFNNNTKSNINALFSFLFLGLDYPYLQGYSTS